MKLDLTIVRDGVETPISTRPGDLVAWEAHTNKSISEWATSTPAFTDIAWLAWRAETKGRSVPFDEWIENVDDIGITAEQGNPTQAGQ